MDRYENVYTSGFPLVLTNLLGFDSYGPSAVVTSDVFGFASFQTHIGGVGNQALWVVQESGAAELPDLAASGNSRMIFTENLTTSGNGTFFANVDSSTALAPYGIATLDINDDGIQDLVVANFNADSLSFFTGAGDGTFTVVLGPPLTTGALPQTIAVGDFNRDGKMDLAVALDGANSVAVYIRDTAASTFHLDATYPLGGRTGQVITGDFNGDGYLDLAIAKKGVSSVSILLGNGNGTFQAKVDYTTGSNPFGVVAADFNRDGILDLAVSNNGTISILTGIGDGTFNTKVDYTVGSGASNAPGIAAGDFNHDGIVDLAVLNVTDQTVSVLLGKADGTFQTHVDYSLGSRTPTAITLGDINGDTYTDILVTVNSGSDAVFVLTGIGDGTFNPLGGSTKFPVGTTPRGIAVGDFNNDHKLDIVTTNSVADTISVLIGK